MSAFLSPPSLLFVSSLRTRLCLPVLGTRHPYRCWDAAACHFRLCGRLLHTVRTRGKGKRQRKEIDLEGKEAGRITGNGKKTTVTPILQFCTTLFFCLYKSYLINSGFALCYPHHFNLCEAVQTQSNAHNVFCLHS